MRAVFPNSSTDLSGYIESIARELRDSGTLDEMRRRVLAGLVLAAGLAVAQDGQKLFAEHCAGCHGSEAEGKDMGPRLAGTRRMRGMSEQQARNVIAQGRVSSGMPAFGHLPAADVAALAKFVRSLNSTAAEAGAAGDAAAGRAFLLGKGGGSGWHKGVSYKQIPAHQT
jgi:mono/diheme cytochrome c family protein